MFQIDRSYIEPIESLESLQGKIWDIRTDYKDDPTLPHIENYGITEEQFEAYLDRKQHFEDFKAAWKKHRLLILVLTFTVPVAIFSLLMRGRDTGLYAYSTGLLLCTLVYLIYLSIEGYRAREFRNNPCETFIKALLSWEENRVRS
ncbi:MAG: hypothetical protein J6W19_12570 [Prevotella sp.]|nr:hypothetical protein [Prevotella sp.]